MKKSFSLGWIGLAIACGTVVWPIFSLVGEEQSRAAKPPMATASKSDVVKETAKKEPEKFVFAVEPKKFNDNVNKGLEYLVKQQNKNGGWGQGGGWRTGGSSGGRVEGSAAEAQDSPDVGNTCIAMLALIRAGNTPTNGTYAKELKAGLTYVLENVEKSDAKSMFVTENRTTQLQSKIGQYIDTFMTTLILSELKGQTGETASNDRIEVALKKTIKKIEDNQLADGTFNGNNGWASVLSQNICSKALNQAVQKGAVVRKDVRDRDYDQTAQYFDKSGGVKTAEAVVTEKAAKAKTEVAAVGEKKASATSKEPVAVSKSISSAASVPSDAGVSLYSTAGNVGRLSQQGLSATLELEKAKVVLNSDSATKEQKEKAGEEIKAAQAIVDNTETVVTNLLTKLDDQTFLSGFGNKGGEEFLSYMNISETLVVKGGKKWETWDRNISSNINRIQNSDGSWSGQHCITGRTFCTATALLTLMADRTTVPESVKIANSK